MRLTGLFLGICLVLALPDGLSADERRMESRLTDHHAKGELEGLHSVLVLKDGARFAEVYFEGEDERWGTPLGRVRHGPQTLHDLRSVTKSIVGLLYGIALEEGKVPPLDAPLVAQFPSYKALSQDPERLKITVRDALNMTMGIAWNEDLPYSDPRNSEIAMELSGDRMGYVLGRPVITEPGRAWVYNGGATAVIGQLIENGTGMGLQAYARQVLFDPLEIGAVDWVVGPHGGASAASGLRMTARDLGRIGQMILDDGRAGSRQVVPKSWLTETFAPGVRTSSGLRYAHFWWQAPEGNPPRWVAGFGNGGQRLVINPELGVVMVLFAGNYNAPDAWKLGVRVLTDFVIPEVTRQ